MEVVWNDPCSVDVTAVRNAVEQLIEANSSGAQDEVLAQDSLGLF